MEWWHFVLIGSAILWLIKYVSDKKSSKRYQEQTSGRQHAIRKLRAGRQHSWKRIATALTLGGYRTDSGGEIESEEVKSEHAAMTMFDLDSKD
jgi:hypothetical protein